MAPNRFGRLLAKALYINVDYRDEPEDYMQSAARSVPSLESFVEAEPTAGEWLSRYRPSVAGLKNYLRILFPFWSWIFHYNVQWLMGDIIAGKQYSLPPV